MRLRQYLDDRKMPIPAFAERIGVSTQAVHRYVAGDRVPRREVMERIKAETGGEVQPNDFFCNHESVAA
jgi:transcriptional regulator with XRE-family HTH domain